MLVLKIVFGIIVTLPILALAEFLFEKTVEDALVGSTAKRRRVPLFKRILPGSKRRLKMKQEEAERKIQQSQAEQQDQAVMQEGYSDSREVSYDEWNHREWQDMDEWLREEQNTDE